MGMGNKMRRKVNDDRSYTSHLNSSTYNTTKARTMGLICFPFERTIDICEYLPRVLPRLAPHDLHCGYFPITAGILQYNPIQFAIS